MAGGRWSRYKWVLQRIRFSVREGGIESNDLDMMPVVFHKVDDVMFDGFVRKHHLYQKTAAGRGA